MLEPFVFPMIQSSEIKNDDAVIKMNFERNECIQIMMILKYLCKILGIISRACAYF